MTGTCERCGAEAALIKVTIFHGDGSKEIVMMCPRCFHAAIRGEYEEDER
jgi:protein-arginine kinase activator protein McsA